jgi:hypothetical protein
MEGMTNVCMICINTAIVNASYIDVTAIPTVKPSIRKPLIKTGAIGSRRPRFQSAMEVIVHRAAMVLIQRDQPKSLSFVSYR